jgi:hypothetical protein
LPASKAAADRAVGFAQKFHQQIFKLDLNDLAAWMQKPTRESIFGFAAALLMRPARNQTQLPCDYIMHTHYCFHSRPIAGAALGKIEFLGLIKFGAAQIMLSHTHSNAAAW